MPSESLQRWLNRTCCCFFSDARDCFRHRYPITETPDDDDNVCECVCHLELGRDEEDER